MADLVMLDSISLPELEWAWANHRPDAMAGYVGGYWPTWPSLESLLGKYLGIRILSIAVSADEDAECLDVETGDATIPQINGWFTRQQGRKVWRPCVYSSADNIGHVVATMTANGFPRASYRLWSAHYTRTPHICGPATCAYTNSFGVIPACDGTQWTDAYFGRSIDASLLSPSFFPAPPPPPKPPVPPPPAKITENDMPLLVNGKNAATPMLVPAGMTKLLLVATDRQQKLPAAKLDVGFQDPWQQETVTVSWESGVVEVAVASGATMGRIIRLDAGDVNVAYGWA